MQDFWVGEKVEVLRECSFLFLFIYLFLAVLGLRFCARAFSSCGEWGPLFIAVRGPLTAAASLLAEHRLQTRRLSDCGSRAQLLRGMWDLPRPGLEPLSPALAGRFSTTAPPAKPNSSYSYLKYFSGICISFQLSEPSLLLLVLIRKTHTLQAKSFPALHSDPANFTMALFCCVLI